MAQQERELLSTLSGRLDKVLAEALGQSRNQVEKLIKAGAVEVEGESVCKPSHRVEEGQRIRYSFLEAPRREELPVDFDVEVLYEDEHLMVLNKPAGVVVHPAPSVREATLVDWLIARGVRLSTLSGEERHGIVHRLDKETSGAIVIAKSNDIHRVLSEELKRREMGRYYLALIDHPLREDVTVDQPIARHPKNRLKMAVLPGGRQARTDFLKLEQGSDGGELIAARLHSGRTHQIRVHLAHLGRHILGDETYGFKSKGAKIPRIFLHARLLYLTHPATGKRLEIAAPLFADMQRYLEKYYERSLTDETLQTHAFVDRFAELFGAL